MAYLAVLSAERGRTASFAAVAGVMLGLAVAGLAASIGLSTLIMTVPVVYEVIRWLGILYMLYLAWDTWRGDTGKQAVRVDASTRAFFQRGLISNMLNPKAYLFYAAVLPEFIDPARQLAPQLALLIAIYVAVATAVHAAIVAFFASLSALVLPGRYADATRRVFAVMLLGVAVWLIWSTAR